MGSVCYLHFFYAAEPPRITSHPQHMKGVVAGKPTFTVETTGTEPLNYQWEWKPAMDDGDEQPCDEMFPGTHSSTLTIPRVQKSNEGSYCCVVSNCAGEQTSCPAKLTLGKNLGNNARMLCMCHFHFLSM